MTEQLTIRLAAPLAEYIAKKAQEDDRSRASVVRRIVADAERAERAKTGQAA